jgi:hypothetical protein
VALGVDNVHAEASDLASGRREAGDQLGVSFRGGLAGVFQPSRLGIVALVEGQQSLARTRIVVKGQLAGTSEATGWDLGIGVRYFFQ